MKKLTFLLLTILIVASAHQAHAVSDKANDKSSNNPSAEKRNENSIKIETPEEEVEDADDDISVTPSETEAWKNHGQYVKSVAQTHPGGKIVSEAARSSIGKKKQPSVTPSVSPSIFPSPTVTPTENPTATPSVTITITPSPTEAVTNEQLSAQIKSLLDEIKELLKSLRHAFKV